MAGEKYNIAAEATEIFNRLQQVPQLAEGLSNLLQNFNSHNHDLRNDGRYQPLGDYQPAGDYAAEAHQHAATDVTEDSTHKFMTQTEKNTLSSLGTKAEMIEAKNFGQNGYKKYSDGMLIQWGYASPVVGYQTVYLPVSFYVPNTSNPNYTVLTTTLSSYEVVVGKMVANRNSSNFRIRSVTSAGDGGEAWNWFAIGRWK